jgi:hypothetical protein
MWTLFRLLSSIIPRKHRLLDLGRASILPLRQGYITGMIVRKTAAARRIVGMSRPHTRKASATCALLLNDDTIRGWFKLFEQCGIEGLTSFDMGGARAL